MPLSPSISSTATRVRSTPRQAGLDFALAGSLDQVVDAWELVYDAYVRAGLIEPSPYRLYTVPQAVRPESAVAIGTLGGLVISTLTAIPEGDDGLPLDQAYPAELDALRQQGRRLAELHLFADRRSRVDRSFSAILGLLRCVFHYAREREVTDFVMGVHPRVAGFYQRYFHFDQIESSESGTPRAVTGRGDGRRDRPVHLMRLDVRRQAAARPLSPEMGYFLENPLPSGAIEQRYGFPDYEVEHTALWTFLRDRSATAGCWW